MDIYSQGIDLPCFCLCGFLVNYYHLFCSSNLVLWIYFVKKTYFASGYFRQRTNRPKSLFFLALFKLLELSFENKICDRWALVQSLTGIILSKRGYERFYDFILPRFHLSCNHLLHTLSTLLIWYSVLNAIMLLMKCLFLFCLLDEVCSSLKMFHNHIPLCVSFSCLLHWSAETTRLSSVSPSVFLYTCWYYWVVIYLRAESDFLCFSAEWHLSILRRIAA